MLHTINDSASRLSSEHVVDRWAWPLRALLTSNMLGPEGIAHLIARAALIWVDVIMDFVSKHAGCHVVAELFYLFSDVSEEGMTGPLTYHHDGEDWTLS